MTITTVSLPDAYSTNLVFSGTQTSTVAWVFQTGQSLTGTASAPADGIISPRHYYVGGDSVDTGNTNLIGLSVEHAVSANHSGGREAIQGYTAIVGTPSVAPGSAGYVGVQGQCRCSANLTGTAGVYTNYKGTVFGGNSNVFTSAGATFLTLINGHEFDVTLSTGASAADKFGISVVQGNNDATRGTYDDAAISIQNQSGAGTTWTRGLSFGGYAHLWPFATDSILIGAQVRQVPSVGTAPALNGIDFSSVTFSSHAIKTPGFTVTSSGPVICTLTTTDPGVLNQLWNSAGTVKVSTGP